MLRRVCVSFRRTVRSVNGSIKGIKMSHHGFRNYQTWVVNLWWKNEQGTHADVYSLAVDCMRRYHVDSCPRGLVISRLAEELENYFEEQSSEKLDAIGECGVLVDLLRSAIDDVDFYEIAESVVDDYWHELVAEVSEMSCE